MVLNRYVCVFESDSESISSPYCMQYYILWDVEAFLKYSIALHIYAIIERKKRSIPLITKHGAEEYYGGDKI